MNRPVVIVDPRSSGIELAPAFRAQGIPSIAVTFKPLMNRLGYGTQVRNSDFIRVIPEQPGLAEIIRAFNPIAIIPGAESGVPLANELTALLTPHYSNDPSKSQHRFHKALMQKALEEAGVPCLKTLDATSTSEVDAWIRENDLSKSALVIKPPTSAGSDRVFHIKVGGDWKTAFQEISNASSNITGKKNVTVVVQEKAEGTEFSVGTVTANGKHYLAHLIQYTKTSYNGRHTVYDHVEFVQFEEKLHGELFEYTKAVLDALGVRWGAAHNEIMLTSGGPRLIESVPRMTGGPVVLFARESTGSSQADKMVEVYTKGDVVTKAFQFKKSVVPVFLKSPAAGRIANVAALSEVDSLPRLFKQFVWFKEGDLVPQTVDYLTAIGIIALSGEKEGIYADYKKIREWESQLKVNRC